MKERLILPTVALAIGLSGCGKTNESLGLQSIISQNGKIVAMLVTSGGEPTCSFYDRQISNTDPTSSKIHVLRSVDQHAFAQSSCRILGGTTRDTKNAEETQ